MSKFNYSVGELAQSALNEVNTNHLSDLGYLNDVLNCGSKDLSCLIEKYGIEDIKEIYSEFYENFKTAVDEIKECENYVKE